MRNIPELFTERTSEKRRGLNQHCRLGATMAENEAYAGRLRRMNMPLRYM